jgi:SWIM zinc finger
MFSYTQIAKDLVETDISNLGIRLYLDGSVGTIEKLLIDNWRIYNVKDSLKVYRVTMPVLHLVLSRNKFNDAVEAILQSTNCTCSYFHEFGACKHVVAVCQSMQKEFLEVEGKGQLTKKRDLEAVGNVLGNIFDVEQKSKFRKLHELFETYFAKSEVKSIYWFEQFVHEVKKTKGKVKMNNGSIFSSIDFGDPNIDYTPFLVELKSIFQNKLRDYDQEKKVYYLMTVSLQAGGRFWWEFWQDLIPGFSQRQQLRLWSEVYRWKMSRITLDYNDLITAKLVSMDDAEKKLILEKLQQDYENNLRLWLDFVLTSRYEQFLVDNLDKFDPELLIDIAYILPEKLEVIEVRIMNQVKIWSDFMKAGEYQEIVHLLSKWVKLGRSDYFWETMKYIQNQHKKKPKLMSILKKLEDV